MTHRRQLILGVIAVAVLLIAGATVGTATAILRARRLREVRIVLGTGIDREMVSVLRDGITGTSLAVSDGRFATVRFMDATEDPSEREWDLLVSERMATDGSESVFGVDPYVLAIRRDSTAPALFSQNMTITQFTRLLAAVEAPDRTRLVVEGDDLRDFAAFILYLAGEILDAPSFENLVGYLRPNGSSDSTEPQQESVDAEAVEKWISRMTPVVAELERWRSMGILAANWTDWDRIAGRKALRDGEAVAVFTLRSDIKRLAWENRTDLAIFRPPSGEARLQYRMYGRSVDLRRGDGVRSDAYPVFLALVTEETFQNRIEADTPLTPVALTDSPINREHLDVVRWYTRAEEFVPIDPALAAHPLFTRLHQILR
jgi:hypothetical protein